ncbi:Uncharacterised protein [uncultured archaeon]|nr:Uncharacterised protein [uncultured archaeon]
MNNSFIQTAGDSDYNFAYSDFTVEFFFSNLAYNDVQTLFEITNNETYNDSNYSKTRFLAAIEEGNLNLYGFEIKQVLQVDADTETFTLPFSIGNRYRFFADGSLQPVDTVTTQGNQISLSYETDDSTITVEVAEILFAIYGNAVSMNDSHFLSAERYQNQLYLFLDGIQQKFAVPAFAAIPEQYVTNFSTHQMTASTQALLTIGANKDGEDAFIGSFGDFKITNGNARHVSELLSQQVIESNFIDQKMNSNIAILADGGNFVDSKSNYSSDELVPGQIFDTTRITVYQTPVNGKGVPIYVAQQGIVIVNWEDQNDGGDDSYGNGYIKIVFNGTGNATMEYLGTTVHTDYYNDFGTGNIHLVGAHIDVTGPVTIPNLPSVGEVLVAQCFSYLSSSSTANVTYTWVTGPASNNPDNFPHAIVTWGTNQNSNLVILGNTIPWISTANLNANYSFSDENGLLNSSIPVLAATNLSVDSTVVITASGTVYYLDGWLASVGPNGDPDQITGNSSSAGTNGPFPSSHIANCPLGVAGLCGAFTDSGNNIIETISVGTGNVFPVPSGATQLLLGVNDDNFGDNGGYFDVSIQSISSNAGNAILTYSIFKSSIMAGPYSSYTFTVDNPFQTIFDVPWSKMNHSDASILINGSPIPTNTWNLQNEKLYITGSYSISNISIIPTGPTHYYSIGENTISYLTSNVYANSSTIPVSDANIFFDPIISNGQTIRGKLFIDNECITYLNRDTDANTLSGLMRGVDGTAVETIHTANTRVIDVSQNHDLSYESNSDAGANIWYPVPFNGETLSAGGTTIANILISDGGIFQE